MSLRQFEVNGKLKFRHAHHAIGCNIRTLDEVQNNSTHNSETARLITAEANGRDVLLSSESFSLCSEESHTKLRDVVLQGFEVHVIATQRESGSWAVSRYHQTMGLSKVTDGFALYNMRAWRSWAAWNCEVLTPWCSEMLSRVYGRDRVHFISMEGTVAAGITQLDTIVCSIAGACQGNASTSSVGKTTTDDHDGKKPIVRNKSLPDLFFEAAVLYNQAAAIMACEKRLSADDGGRILEALGLKEDNKTKEVWHERSVTHPGLLIRDEPMVECVPMHDLPVLISKRQIITAMQANGRMHNFDNRAPDSSGNYCFLNPSSIFNDDKTLARLHHLLRQDGCWIPITANPS